MKFRADISQCFCDRTYSGAKYDDNGNAYRVSPVKIRCYSLWERVLQMIRNILH